MRVSLQRGVRLLGEGRVLVGGAPLRAVTLTARGAEVVTGWTRPAAIGPGLGRQGLARRLLDAEILVPHPGAEDATDQLTFVVPVRDRPHQLTRCLKALRRTAPGAAVIIVDDGSVQPVALPAGDRIRVVRHGASRGPSAARNAGLTASATAFVGFVDSDVVLPETAAARLLAHFEDPGVAAVAPRICALGGHGPVAAYEARHSPLDMGPAGGLVAPGRPVPYLPSAVLFVRRDAVAIGFDEALPIGEDVDFIWRLQAAGWRIRYAPEVEVLHEHPVTLRQFAGRRHLYARSVGMLARRHPAALPCVWVTPLGALIWALAVAGRRREAAAAVLWSAARTRARLRPLGQGSGRLAAVLAARGLGHVGLGLSRAIRRAWSPVLLVAATRDARARRVLTAAFAAGVLEDGLKSGSPRAALADAPLGVLGEMIAAVGTWHGCLSARTIRPLLPSFSRAPRRAP